MIYLKLKSRIESDLFSDIDLPKFKKIKIKLFARRRKNTDIEKERVMLVGLYGHKATKRQAEEYLEELKMLTETAGGNPIEKVLQNRSRPDISTYVGKGKLQELKGQMKALKIKTIIFDDDLSPTQIRNIEAGTDAKVLDRSALILDIFASRAKTAAKNAG